MHKPPPFAPDDIQKEIVAALKDKKRWFLDNNDSTSRGYMDRWGITAKGLSEDLSLDLETYHLYLKPPQAGSPPSPQRYQYVLPYPEDGDYPELLVHITLSPRGQPPRVMLSVHPHNTGHAPLRRVPL